MEEPLPYYEDPTVLSQLKRLPEIQTRERVFQKAQNVAEAATPLCSASGPAHVI